MTRIEQTFETLKKNNKKAFISFIMAGDPCFKKSLAILNGLPASGVDLIEIGIPFTDPMADGPAIQLAGQRSIASGTTLERVLSLVQEFRKNNNKFRIRICIPENNIKPFNKLRKTSLKFLFVITAVVNSKPYRIRTITARKSK